MQNYAGCKYFLVKVQLIKVKGKLRLQFAIDLLFIFVA